MTSPRFYIYGITADKSREFLHTVLCAEDAKKFCKDHEQVFKGRFTAYTYGQMHQEQDDWVIIAAKH